jgi:hypothetical protein
MNGQMLMINELSQRLPGYLSLQVLSPDVLRVTDQNSDTEASVSLVQLKKRLRLCEKSEHSRIIDAFAGRIGAAFGVSYPLLIDDIFPRVLPPFEDKSLSAPWTFDIADGGLKVALAQDQGVNLRLLPPLEIVRIGIGVNEVKARAIENLKKTTSEIKWEKTGEGRAARFGDGFMASRVLVLEKWLSEPCWVGLPCRDELWLWPRPPTEECSRRLFICAQNTPHSISEQFWFWTPDKGLRSWRDNFRK